MSDTPSFQELLADFAGEDFVGREEQLALFEKALAAARPPFLILAVSGQGGVVKTLAASPLCPTGRLCTAFAFILLAQKGESIPRHVFAG